MMPWQDGPESQVEKRRSLREQLMRLEFAILLAAIAVPIAVNLVGMIL